jgi:hypothetical protein
MGQSYLFSLVAMTYLTLGAMKEGPTERCVFVESSGTS